MDDDPFSDARIARAQEIVHATHEKAEREAGGDRAQVRRMLWATAQKNQTFQVALARLVIAVGQVVVADVTAETVDFMPARLHDLPMSRADLPDLDPRSAVLPEHDPLSPNKMAAAGEVFASAMLRATERTNGDPVAGRRLLWAWAKQDAELGIAVLRLGASDKMPVVMVTLPTVVSEEASRPWKT